MPRLCSRQTCGVELAGLNALKPYAASEDPELR
jgi:hypothetical protein